jgi:hypothetical protein
MPGKNGMLFREWKDETSKHEGLHRHHSSRIRGMRQAKRKDRRLHLNLIFKDEHMEEFIRRSQIH